MQPTPEQQAVIDHRDGTALVLAVAGAGKTMSVTRRVQAMIAEGASGRAFFLASYSSSAVGALDKRLEGTGATCATLHRLAIWVLKAAGDDRRIAKDESASLQRLTGDAKLTKQCLRDWQLERANLLHPDGRYAALQQTNAQTSQRMYEMELSRAHLRALEERGEVSLADLIPEAALYLFEHPALSERIARRYAHWTCDEYQDVNSAQSVLLNLAAKHSSSYLAVGDDDQAIYGFQGASTRHILEFQAQHAGSRVYRMTENFRNPTAAVAIANAVIEGNSERYGKQAQATQGFTGSAALHLSADNAVQGLEIIRNELGAYAPQEITVLSRQRKEAAGLVKALCSAGIPVQSSDHPRVRAAAKTLKALAELAELSRKPRKSWESSQLESAQSALTMLMETTRSKAALPRVLKHLRSGKPTLSALRLEGHTAHCVALTSALESRTAAAQQLVNLGVPDPDGLAAYSEAALEALEVEHGVQVMTMHASKGLEWRVVILLDTCSTALMSQADIEEERRLHYVALTRATHHLHILRHPEAKDALIDTVTLNNIIRSSTQTGAALERAPTSWDASDAELIGASVTALPLKRYYATYAKSNLEIARAVVRFSGANRAYWLELLN